MEEILVVGCPWAVRFGDGGKWGWGKGLTGLSDFLNYVRDVGETHI